VGHLSSNIDEVIRFFILSGLHFLLLPETQLVEHSTIVGTVRARGFKLYSVLRPRSSENPDKAVGGGLALLVRSSTRIVKNADACKCGAISVAVTPKGMGTVNVIGVYLPVAGTKLFRDASGALCDGREEALRYVVREYKRLRGRGAPVVILGDFNARLISTAKFPRTTSGTIPPASTWMKRTNAQMQALCAACGLIALHGSKGQLPGENTSEVPGHPGLFYEIDYALVDPSVRARSRPYGPFGRYKEMHRAVLFTISVNSPQPTAEAPQSTTVPPRCFLYGDGRGWTAIARAISGCLPKAARVLRDPDKPLDEKIAAIEKAVRDGARRGHKKCHRHPFRTHIFRRFRQLAIPPELAAMLARARGLRRNARDLNRRGKRARLAAEAYSIAGDDRARAEAGRATGFSAAATRLYAESRQLQEAVSASMEPIVDAWQATCLHDLNRLRRRDFHYYCKAIDLGADADVHDPSAGFIPPNEAGDPPLQTFTNHFKSVMAAGAAPPALVDETLEAGLPSVHRGPQPPLGLDIGRDISVEDVRSAVRGPSKAHPPRQCHPSCIICAERAKEHTAWRHLGGPIPKCTAAHLNTSKAAGPDGLKAEWIKWLRIEGDGQGTLELHQRLDGAIAGLLTRILRHGAASVDSKFADSIISPILKPVKAGGEVDAASAACYRPVALISLLNKLLKIILADRLACFLSVNGTIGPEQAGFVNFRSCERQVFTILETVKARLRLNQSTYVLFLDFRAAYDKVHRGALARVLRHIGIAENVVALLEHLMTISKASVRVNGSVGDPFPTKTGVPQGDPLSCLLFVVFIEGLSRYLCSRPDVHGVEALGVNVAARLFADDVAALASNRAELQRILNHVGTWCKAWGMDINTNVGKTEGMLFTPSSILMGADAYKRLCPAPLDLDGTPIHWVDRYRYLGYDLRHNLDQSHFVSLRRGAAMGAYVRLLIRNPYIRASPIGTQTQLRDTMLQGNLIYLASLLHVPRASLKAMDAVILRYAKTSLDATRSPCNAALLCGTRALLATHTFARERERLHLTLEHDVHCALPEERWPSCTKLFRALKNEPTSNATLRGPLTNWVHVSERKRSAAARRGAVLLAPSPARSPSTCAHVFGRSLALVDARADIGPPPVGHDRIPTGEPESNGSKKHFCALSFWLVTPPDLLGHQHGFTPASAIGPGSCSGNWLSLSVDHRYPAVAAAQGGCSALRRWPFAPKARKPAPLQPSAANRAPYSEQFEYRLCAACGRGRDTIYHLIVSCQHEAMQAHRRSLWASALSYMSTLYESLRTLAERSARVRHGQETPIPGLPPLDDEAARVFVSLREPPPPSAESAFLLYWLLHVTSWPAHVASHMDGPWQPVARTFGALFDAIALPHTSLRKTADEWATWAEAELRALALTRLRIILGRSA
jgi:hypothetical protein